MIRPTKDNPDKRWDLMFQLAKDFYLQYGHLLIPNRYIINNFRLGKWIGTQRQDYRKRSNPLFTQRRIELLESIKMIWDIKESQWLSMYEELKNYYQTYQNTRVAQSYITPSGKQLGIWLNRQRMQYKAHKLSPNHQLLLEQLDIIWNPEKLRRGTWNSYFQALSSYLQKHDGRYPPTNHITENHLNLGQWLSNQREYYKNGTLTPEREKRLSEIGCTWDAKSQQWNYYYHQANHYFKQYGHLCPYLYREKQGAFRDLLSWLSRQRTYYQKGKLSPTQVNRLNTIGMVWDVHEALWQEMYRQAKCYYQEHGHLLVSKNVNTSENSRLGLWISTQRKNYQSQSNRYFTSEHIQLLEEIGMVWDASVDSQTLWEKRYQQAACFFNKHGHLLPPKGRLQTWIMAQRYAKRGGRGDLSPKQIDRLNKIGMVWEPMEERWQSMYQRAKKYYQIHHMLNIPCSYLCEDGVKLGQWIAHQRSGYRNLMAGRRGQKKNRITPEHIELLNQIGMIWDGDTVTCYTSQQEKTILYYLKKVFPDAGKLSQWQTPGFEFELDIYLPSIRTAIEYDGVVWHREKQNQDEEKGRACQQHNIRLIRIREPGLPVISACEHSISLSETDAPSLEQAIRQLFGLLNLPAPDCDLSRDHFAIYQTYKDYTSRKWDQMYEIAYRYYKQFGDLHFNAHTKTEDIVCLKNWIHKQRTAYRNDELTPLQIEKLEEIGMIWDPFEFRWIQMFRLAEEYKKEYGNLEISPKYHTVDGIALGSWLSKQKSAYQKSKLSPKHIHLLEHTGIRWRKHSFTHSFKQISLTDSEHFLSAPEITDSRKSESAPWEFFFSLAQNYFYKYGNLHITAHYHTDSGDRLGEWLCNQREEYRKGSLCKEKIKRLEMIGIQWNVLNDRWEEMFAAAKSYYLAHKTLWVSPKYVTPDGIPLGSWISQQRKKYKEKGRSKPLTSDQKCRLEEIGMIWDPYSAKWMAKYRLAQKFYLKNGHLDIPVNYIAPGGEKLGMWLGCQRQAMRGNPNYAMTKERKELLDAIGMKWNLK